MNSSQNLAVLRALIEVDTARALRSLSGFKSSYGDVANTLRSSKTSWEQAQASIDHFGDALTHVRNISQAAFANMKEGARSVALRESLGEDVRAVGGDLNAFVAKLDAAAQGTISNYNLMLSASKAMSLGLTSDVDEIAALLEIARDKSRAMGTETTDAFNDIVTGLARGSPLILDNLGIMIDLESTYKDYAATLGIAASQLDETQKKEALLQSVLASGQSVLGDSGAQVGQLADHYAILETNIKNSVSAWQEIAALAGARLTEDGGFLSNIVDPEAAATALKQLQAIIVARDAVIAQNPAMTVADQWAFTSASNVGNMEAARAVLEKFPGAWDQYRIAMAAATDQTGLTNGALIAVLATVNTHASVYNNASDAMAQYNALAYQQSAALAELQGVQAGQTQQTDKASDATYGFGVMAALARGEAAALATQAGILTGELYGIVDGANAAGMALANALGADVLGRYEAGLNRLDTSRLKGGNNLSLGSTGGGVRNVFTAQANTFRAVTVAATGAARSGVSAAEKAKRDHEKIATDIARAYESEFNRIAGVAGQQLNFSTSIGEFDALMDRFGVRNQNENTETARRLAAVRDDALKGKRSEWIDKSFPELSGSEGDELAARAQSVLEAYQKGLRPDLVNLDSLVAETREALLAQANLKGLQDEAAGILMAEGFGADAIAKQFGENSSEIQGVLAEQLGIASMGAGESASVALVDSIVAGMARAADSKQEQLRESGRAIGKYVREGLSGEFSDIGEVIIAGVIESLVEAA